MVPGDSNYAQYNDPTEVEEIRIAAKKRVRAKFTAERIVKEGFELLGKLA